MVWATKTYPLKAAPPKEKCLEICQHAALGPAMGKEDVVILRHHSWVPCCCLHLISEESSEEDPYLIL